MVCMGFVRGCCHQRGGEMRSIVEERLCAWSLKKLGRKVVGVW
jgi:hypothetical protein